NGTDLQMDQGPKYSALDVVTKTSSCMIGGIAVQASGQYLFVSHPNLNELHVLDKVSGALVQTAPLSAPGRLGADGQKHVWVANNNGGSPRAEKYTVNGDGTLTLASTISSLSNPLAIAISSDDKTVVIVDGGSAQQVKGFANDNPFAPLWTLGEA